ncbi:GNAT family N-acetyltransferase [Rhizobium lusitanum]|uniref:RimJ/RimL family protein N-acetyltransferase n=1 Tax=Rhizobium lusitanum TaxID=293958 RepID=A0A7X0IQX9_9HYPH|nr:GNAT family protein [Rhizobium lusitanum]MBB6485524.1 RimJ/RimL family protein N-acetyltransferase [Rhizobium lusitanum]
MLSLKPFSTEHFAVLPTWFDNERELAQWGGPGFSHPLDASQLAPLLQVGHGDRPERHCWMAEDESSSPVGHAQLVYDWQNGVARIARVAIAPAMRGRGIAVPMLKLVLARAFSEGAIERVELNVYTWNEPAIRTYAKLGLIREGVRRSSAKVGEERWDTAIMGILRAEWNEVVTAI